MELLAFGPDDTEAVRRAVQIINAVRAADAPFEHPRTEHETVGMLRHGWDLEPADAFLLVPQDERVDRAVAVGTYDAGTRDNLHLAWLSVEVHPEHRRRGHGSTMFAGLLERARAAGRTSIGTDGWALPGTVGFAARHHLEHRHTEVARRQVLADLDRACLDRLRAEALPHAVDYELVRLLGPTPDDELEATAVMVAAINDAPLDELDIEDEVFTPERVRAYETAMSGRGILVHRVYARHRETGELAGQTVVGVELERPHLADQHDTSVVARHRGHRLGLLLKLEMLQWLLEIQPQVAMIDTWNAASNTHMVGVNETLGYRVLGHRLAFQRPA